MNTIIIPSTEPTTDDSIKKRLRYGHCRLKMAHRNFLFDLFLKYSLDSKIKILSGKDAFDIYDIYGLDLSEIFLLASSHGLEDIDIDEFCKIHREHYDEVFKRVSECLGEKDG